jgi:very-short-patch-repair endonuclease
LQRGGRGGGGKRLDTLQSALFRRSGRTQNNLRSQAKNQFFNREDETEKRQRLRRSMPQAEVILWSRLKGRQLLGCKFRRQYSVGEFVIDFFSVEAKLGIELDGDTHFQQGVREYDRKRQEFIESFGIRVIRILNTDVYQNLDGVLEMIGREVLDRRAERKPL